MTIPKRPATTRMTRAEGTLDTMQVLLDGEQVHIIAPVKSGLGEEDSADGRTTPLYRLHGVEHPDDLVGKLQETRSAFIHESPRFQVKGVMGEGSQGLIIRVHDRDCRRDVALKTLHHTGCDLDEISRFIHEAQITAQLEHPSIVPVHDVGVLADGTVYYTMKRVEGVNLADHLLTRAGKPELRFELLELFLRACEAIAFAHSRGVIHRDLKPRNIMVGPFGEVLVLDWGLAKIVGTPPTTRERIKPQNLPESDGDVHRTMDGHAVGTPAYMSPEQARGSHQIIVDQRCDVYSLGVILYEILAGTSPYQRGSVRKTLEQVARGQWIPLLHHSTAYGVPKRLVAIVHKALSTEVAQRYQTVNALIEDLHLFLAGGQVGAYVEAPVEKLCRHINNHRRLVVSVGLTVLLALLGIGAWRWHEMQVEAAKIAELHEQANSLELTRNFADAKTKLELIRDLKGEPEVASQLERIQMGLLQEQEIKARAEKMAEARKLIAEAERLIGAESEEDLTAAANTYLKAMGLTGNEPAVTHAYTTVTAKRVAKENERLEQAKKQEREHEIKARIQQWEKAVDLAEREGRFDEAIGLLTGLLEVRWSKGDDERRKAVQGKLDEQINNRQAEERRLAADNYFSQIQKEIARDKPEDAAANLERMRALCPKHQDLATGQQLVEEARSAARKKKADVCLVNAALAREAADTIRKELTIRRETVRQLEIDLLDRNIPELREQLHIQEEDAGKLESKLSARQAEVIRFLQQAENEDKDYERVKRSLADYYVERIDEAEREGRLGDAAAAAEQAKHYDVTGQYAAELKGETTVICAASSLPLMLTLIQEGADRCDRALGQGIVIEPGSSIPLPCGRYEVRTLPDTGVVCARVFRRSGREYPLDLRRPPNLPSGMLVIPGGPVRSWNGSEIMVPGFALGRYEVTCGEYLAFLNDSENLRRYVEERSTGRLILAPRSSFESSDPLWHQRSVPVWEKNPGEFLLEWRESRGNIAAERPVTGISYEDIEAFLRWRSLRDPERRVWRLPTPGEWMLAAQGGDGREYPWGIRGDPWLCASGLEAERWERELAVGGAVKDRSVQGVCDLAGSVCEFTSGQGAKSGWRVVMGGSYVDRQADRFTTRSHREWSARTVHDAVGFRVALSIAAP